MDGWVGRGLGVIGALSVGGEMGEGKRRDEVGWRIGVASR